MLVLDKLDRIMRRAVMIGGGRSISRRVKGHELHWYELEGTGQGVPAVLVHGLGGNANTFFPILSALRRGYSRLYAPDLPGHGFAADASSGPLDLRGLYDTLQGFLDEVVGEPAVMIGNSMGGALSLQTAIDRPETPGLGLLAPAGAPLGASGHAHLERHFQVASSGDGRRLLRAMMHRPPAGSWIVGADIVEAFGRPVVHHVLSTARGDEEAVDTTAMRRLAMPVTLVWGASERLLPPRGIDFFRDHLPSHARIEVFEKCGHVPMLEQPRRTAAVLNDLATEAARRARSRAGADRGN